jgi:hypothetical protein
MHAHPTVLSAVICNNLWDLYIHERPDERVSKVVAQISSTDVFSFISVGFLHFQLSNLLQDIAAGVRMHSSYLRCGQSQAVQRQE